MAEAASHRRRLASVVIEFSLWISPGQLAKSNAEQVAEMRARSLRGWALQIASPDEARRCWRSRAATRSGSRVTTWSTEELSDIRRLPQPALSGGDRHFLSDCVY